MAYFRFRANTASGKSTKMTHHHNQSCMDLMMLFIQFISGTKSGGICCHNGVVIKSAVSTNSELHSNGLFRRFPFWQLHNAKISDCCFRSNPHLRWKRNLLINVRFLHETKEEHANSRSSPINALWRVNVIPTRAKTNAICFSGRPGNWYAV